MTWLEGQDDFRNPGVPHFAGPDTPSIRGPVDNHDGITDYLHQNQLAKANQAVVQVGNKYKFTELTKYYHSKFNDVPFVVTKVGPQNVSIQFDNSPKKIVIMAEIFRNQLRRGGIVPTE